MHYCVVSRLNSNESVFVHYKPSGPSQRYVPNVNIISLDSNDFYVVTGPNCTNDFDLSHFAPINLAHSYDPQVNFTYAFTKSDFAHFAPTSDPPLSDDDECAFIFPDDDTLPLIDLGIHVAFDWSPSIWDFMHYC